MFGSHCLKTWSSTQSVIALSSGEAEFYGIVRGAAQGLGSRSMFGDLGVAVSLRVMTDASAATGIAVRKGLGKVRHIDVSQLWIQDAVARGELQLTKVSTKENLADILTKHVDRGVLEQQGSAMGFQSRANLHDLAPGV